MRAIFILIVGDQAQVYQIIGATLMMLGINFFYFEKNNVKILSSLGLFLLVLGTFGLPSSNVFLIDAIVSLIIALFISSVLTLILFVFMKDYLYYNNITLVPCAIIIMTFFVTGWTCFNFLGNNTRPDLINGLSVLVLIFGSLFLRLVYLFFASKR